MTSSTLKNKPLKWTTQRVNNNIKSTTPSRVHKRTPSKNTMTASMMTAEIKSGNPTKEIEKLTSELEFTYDTVATITVHFESLQHAYNCSKPELERSKSETRLGEMEKELLTAYDDLGLQVTHLERKIAKLEKRLSQLRELESVNIKKPVQVKESPALSLNNDINLILSPCSSIDSSVTDNQFESFYCNDWTLSQVINNEYQPTLDNFAATFPLLQQQQGCNNVIELDYYQELYCDLNMYNNDESFLSYPLM